MFKETKSANASPQKNLNDIFSEAKGSSYLGPIMKKKCIKSLTIDCTE